MAEPQRKRPRMKQQSIMSLLRPVGAAADQQGQQQQQRQQQPEKPKPVPTQLVFRSTGKGVWAFLKDAPDVRVGGADTVHRMDRKELEVTHVEVDTAFAGRGLAAKIMDYVADTAQDVGLVLVPTCSYAALHWCPRNASRFPQLQIRIPPQLAAKDAAVLVVAASAAPAEHVEVDEAADSRRQRGGVETPSTPVRRPTRVSGEESRVVPPSPPSPSSTSDAEVASIPSRVNVQDLRLEHNARVREFRRGAAVIQYELVLPAPEHLPRTAGRRHGPGGASADQKQLQLPGLAEAGGDAPAVSTCRDANLLLLRRLHVPRSMQGQGVATRLIRDTLRWAQTAGFSVLPVCPEIRRRYFEARLSQPGPVPQSPAQFQQLDQQRRLFLEQLCFLRLPHAETDHYGLRQDLGGVTVLHNEQALRFELVPASLGMLHYELCEPDDQQRLPRRLRLWHLYCSPLVGSVGLARALVQAAFRWAVQEHLPVVPEAPWLADCYVGLGLHLRDGFADVRLLPPELPCWHLAPYLQPWESWSSNPRDAAIRWLQLWLRLRGPGPPVKTPEQLFELLACLQSPHFLRLQRQFVDEGPRLPDDAPFGARQPVFDRQFVGSTLPWMQRAAIALPYLFRVPLPEDDEQQESPTPSQRGQQQSALLLLGVAPVPLQQQARTQVRLSKLQGAALLCAGLLGATDYPACDPEQLAQTDFGVFSEDDSDTDDGSGDEEEVKVLERLKAQRRDQRPEQDHGIRLGRRMAWPRPNFSQLMSYASGSGPSQQAKLVCVLRYLGRLAEDPEFGTQLPPWMPQQHLQFIMSHQHVPGYYLRRTAPLADGDDDKVGRPRSEDVLSFELVRNDSPLPGLLLRHQEADRRRMQQAWQARARKSGFLSRSGNPGPEERSVEEAEQQQETLLPEDWSRLPLVPLRVEPTAGIEEATGLLQVDFANRFLGGGVLGRGCVQEEIRFVLSPECLLGMLCAPMMDANEALLILGTERYSEPAGYGSRFRWAGPHRDRTPVSRMAGRPWMRCSVITAVDALDFGGYSSGESLKQWQLNSLYRELDKAATGFCVHPGLLPSHPEVRPPDLLSAPANADLDGDILMSDGDGALLPWNSGVATGNWGCGAFGGDPQLKAVLQWIAASLGSAYRFERDPSPPPPGDHDCPEQDPRRRWLLYHSFADPRVDSLARVVNLVRARGLTVGRLFELARRFGLLRLQQAHADFFSWLCDQLTV